MPQHAIQLTPNTQLIDGELYVDGLQRTFVPAETLAALIIATEGLCATAIAELFPNSYVRTVEGVEQNVEPWREYVAAVQQLRIEREEGDCGWPSAKQALTWCARATVLTALNRSINVTDDVAVARFLAEHRRFIDVTPQSERDYLERYGRYLQAHRDALDPECGDRDIFLNPPPRPGWDGPMLEWPSDVGAVELQGDILTGILTAGADISVQGVTAYLRLQGNTVERTLPETLVALMKLLPTSSAEPIQTSLRYEADGRKYDIRVEGTPLRDGQLVWSLRPAATAPSIHGFERALAQVSQGTLSGEP